MVVLLIAHNHSQIVLFCVNLADWRLGNKYRSNINLGQPSYALLHALSICIMMLVVRFFSYAAAVFPTAVIG
jgi:hypothetical protein